MTLHRTARVRAWAITFILCLNGWVPSGVSAQASDGPPVTLSTLAARGGLPRIAGGASHIDDVIGGAKQVSGRFPRSSSPGQILVRRDPTTGSPTHYQVFRPDGLPVKRVDLTGRSHGGISTPHVVEFERHMNPRTGQVFVRPGHRVRSAHPEEVPNG